MVEDEKGIFIHISRDAMDSMTLADIEAALWSMFHSHCEKVVVIIKPDNE